MLLDIDITSISSHAEAEALVERAHREALHLSQYSPLSSSGTGRSPLSTRLSAYDGCLTLERKQKESGGRIPGRTSPNAPSVVFLHSGLASYHLCYRARSFRPSRIFHEIRFNQSVTFQKLAPLDCCRICPSRSISSITASSLVIHRYYDVSGAEFRLMHFNRLQFDMMMSSVPVQGMKTCRSRESEKLLVE